MIEIAARGHENVLGTHKTTLEITKDPDLTLTGDCIIGVSAEMACLTLPEETKEKLKSGSAFKVTLRVGDLSEEIIGFGNPDLILTNEHDIVLRKSEFIDDRTLLIKCDKACADLSREFVEKLKSPDCELVFELKEIYFNE